MKFKEYIRESNKSDVVSLVGMGINGQSITSETPNRVWDGEFCCSHLGLTSLKGCPKKIDGVFDCSNNKLKSLEYGPEDVSRAYDCSNNRLTSLEYMPTWVHGFFSCTGNKLTSLKGAPSRVGHNFYCERNNITSFKDIHKIIHSINGRFFCLGNPIKSHVLGLLLIPGIRMIDFEPDKWAIILNKYLDKGRAGLIDCQNELIEAGYEEHAQL